MATTTIFERRTSIGEHFERVRLVVRSDDKTIWTDKVQPRKVGQSRDDTPPDFYDDAARYARHAPRNHDPRTSHLNKRPWRRY